MCFWDSIIDKWSVFMCNIVVVGVFVLRIKHVITSLIQKYKMVVVIFYELDVKPTILNIRINRLIFMSYLRQNIKNVVHLIIWWLIVL